MPPPDHPKIFHITHVDNLREIVRTSALWSDARRRELGLDCQVVGMATIILHMANHSELTYKGGQGPIVHLVADLRETVGWAEGQCRR